MKHRMLAFICLLALSVSCTPTPQQRVVLVSATPWIITATSAATDTPTPSPTPTVTPINTPTPTVTPTNTPTPTPEITPHPFTLFHNDDPNSIPAEVFKSSRSIQVGNYYYNINSDVGPDTVVERLNGYPGFKGAVIHTNVKGPPAAGNPLQHAFVSFERAPDRQIEGAWAFEASYIVLKAPPRLKHSGWSGDPLATLTSLLMHLPDQKFRAAGGVHLLTNNGVNYYVSVYRVNRGDPGVTPDNIRKVKFEIGVKQGLRVELFYDSEHDNQPTLRAFLIHAPDTGRKYELIGQIALAEDIKKIRGDLTWLGGYVSESVTNYEVVVGEAKVLR